MLHAAKLIIAAPNDSYLMLYRADHPRFGDDPDLPGGTVEHGEDSLQGMVREAYEEAGIIIDPLQASLLYQGNDYSHHSSHYALFFVHLDQRPAVTLSWEHSSYQWLSRQEFLRQSSTAEDTFMHMVADVLGKTDK